MKKVICIILFFIVFSVKLKSQSLHDLKTEMKLVDSLLQLNKIGELKGLRKSKKITILYIVRGNKELEYLVLKVNNKFLREEYFKLLENGMYSYLRNLEQSDKFEIIVKK